MVRKNGFLILGIWMLVCLGLSLIPDMTKAFYVVFALMLFVAFTLSMLNLIHLALEKQEEETPLLDKDYNLLYSLTR